VCCSGSAAARIPRGRIGADKSVRLCLCLCLYLRLCCVSCVGAGVGVDVAVGVGLGVAGCVRLCVRVRVLL